MKKTYVKPMVAFENFQMTSNIAACGNKINSFSMDQNCEYFEIAPGIYNVFGNTDSCQYIPVDGEDEKSCYHVPTTATQVFGS